MTGRGRAPALLLLAVLAHAACGDGDAGPATPVSDSVYVEVMARLVLLDSALAPRTDPPGAGEGARVDSLRRRVMVAWGVGADQLLDYAETRGTSPGQMQKIWQRVYQLSDSLKAAGWDPPGGAPRDSAPAAGDSLRGT